MKTDGMSPAMLLSVNRCAPVVEENRPTLPN